MDENNDTIPSINIPDTNDDIEMEPPQEPLTPITTNYTTFDEFEKAVAARVFHHLSQTDMSAENIAKCVQLFPQRFDFILQKFADGQREHGGDFSKIDHASEGWNEIADLVCYIGIGMFLKKPTISVELP